MADPRPFKKTLMEVRVNYKCLSTARTGQVKLCIYDWESKRVYDIKEAIQEALHAPMCDQEIIYQGRVLDSNSSPLKNLYFREGDELEVHFTTEVDLREVQELLNDLKQFRLKVCTNQDSLLEITTEDLASDYSPLEYIDVTRALELLAFRFFAPWKTAKSLANRRFFVQDGGLDIFMAIFKFSFKHYSDGTQEADEQGEPEKRQLDSQMIVETLRFLNAEQTQLLVSCLTFLWNFSETGQDRKLMIEKGVLPLATKALLLDPYAEYYFDPLSELRELMIEVNEQAIGCVAGCVEFDANAQEAVVNNDNAIAKIIAMMDRNLAKTRALSMFCSQLASNSLFYCTFNLKTHSSFVQKGLLHKVLDITKVYTDVPGGDMVLRYYCCLVLARLRSSPAVELEKEIVQTIDELINGFLDIHKPSEMLVWEKDHFYVWVTLVPMIHLAFACGPPGKENGSQAKIVEAGLTHTPKRRKSTDEKKQEMEIEFVTCGARTTEGTSHFQCEYTCKEAAKQQGMVKNGAGTSSTGNAMDTTGEICGIKEESFHEKEKQEFSTKLIDEVPQKNDIDFNNSDSEIGGTQELGSLSVGRLGLFALSYLLCLEENRQLIRSESMLGYLVCLSWHLRPEERDQLQEQLNKFPDVKAPSLKTIAKSVLARIHGLQAVFRM